MSMQSRQMAKAGRSSFMPPARGLIQRKCGCGLHTPNGGACGDCAGKQNGLQRRLAIGASNDPLEHEADRVAEQVLSRPAGTTIVPSAPLIHRSTAHGLEQGPQEAPASVDRVLAASGQRLDAATREDMEQRFGHDFSQVRVHHNSAAEHSAQEIGAMAYTIGQDIVFGAGHYSPSTRSGRFTLAHELAHVVQQQGGSEVAQKRTDPGERTEAAPVQLSGEGRPTLRRRLVVNPTDTVPLAPGTAGPARTLVNAVGGLLRDTCPTGGFTIDAASGVVSGPSRFCEWHPPLVPGKTEADISSTPAGCKCLCDVVNNTKTTTVGFTAGGPGTSPGSRPASAAPVAGSGGVRTDAQVSIDPRFQGQYRISGKWVDVPFHLLFSHELCGHALPKMQGTHQYRGAGTAGGTPPQEQHAVDVERAIAAEHNPPLPRRPEDYSGAARQRP
jgi:hypothetical protein